MSTNFAEFNLIKLVGTPDLTSVKSLHYRLSKANWIKQDIFHQTIFNAVKGSFQGINSDLLRRIIDAIIERCMIFSLDHSTGTMFFKLQNEIRNSTDLAANVMAVIDSRRIQERPLRQSNINQGALVQRPNHSQGSSRWPRADKAQCHAPIRNRSNSNSSSEEHILPLLSRTGASEYIPPLVTPSTPDNMVTSFLHCMRKLGMDMLLPVELHDNCLACMYSAFKIYNQLAHRELIELIMDAQAGEFAAELKGATKTKLRGVIAILKNADILITKNPSRDLFQEANHLLIFEVLLEEATSIAMDEVMKENNLKSQKIVWQPLRVIPSKDAGKDLGFQIICEVISTIAREVALELYKAQYLSVIHFGDSALFDVVDIVEKEAVLLEMDETVLDLSVLRRRHDQCIISSVLSVRFPIIETMLKGLIWDSKSGDRERKLERMQSLQHRIEKYFFEKMQQGSIMHSRKSSKSISATTSVEDAPSVGFHSSSITSYDTWDQDHGKSISSLSQSQPPLMRAVHPTPIINPSSLKPVVLSSKAREFAPEMRYSSIKQNYPLNTSENAGESTPTNYFPTDITMHRSRSGSEGYTVQYTHPPGFTPHAQYPTLSTQSPDNSIFRSCSHDEIDDDIVYPFSSPRTHCFSPKYGAANFGPPTSESIISDISLSEEDFNYFIINNEPPSIQNILNRHPEDEAQIDSILSKIMRTASKPLGVIEHQHTQLTPVIEERRDYRTSSEEYYDTNAL